jgi:pimeloyl-ACP methyl ester carboxylesterase
MQDAGNRCYNDLSKADRKHWVTELKPHPASAQLTPLTYLAYKHHPVTYLFCTDDQALPYGVQKTMVENAQEAGLEVQTETFNTSHSPFLSQPEIVLGAIEKITAAA